MEAREKFEQKYTRALEVCELIKDYFGEELTDCQENTYNAVLNYLTTTPIEEINNSLLPPIVILIKFPRVRVTNDNDNSVEITNLFVRLEVTCEGYLKQGFQMARTEYTLTQWLSNYCHSHVSFTNSRPEEFLNPCYGSGPILRTIRFLRDNFDIQRWGLFCFELSKYVTVESLRGGPYNRLENIGRQRRINLSRHIIRGYVPSKYPKNAFETFVKEFVLQYDWKFAYDGKKYILGEPLLTFWINVSNAFIKWHNKKCDEK